MLGPIKLRSILELVLQLHFGVKKPPKNCHPTYDSQNQIQVSSTRHTHNFPGTCLLCKSASAGGSVLFVTSVPPHSCSQRDQDLLSHQSFVRTKGYLGVVGADRATAVPGAVWVAVFWGRKQVMSLLLRPRLHEIHH